MGGFSLNVYKTITTGDGGMLITDSLEYYESAFSLQDQGYKRKGSGLQMVAPSILGLNFRINELTGAVALAQLRKLDRITSTLRGKKRKLKEKISGIEGVGFRKLHDEEGETGTLLTVIFETAERAAKVANRLGTETIDLSGWHVYSNMDHLNRHLKELDRPHGKGAYPRTDDILSRSINISIGVVDPGLGAGFGINIDSSDDKIDEVADLFRRVCEEVI